MFFHETLQLDRFEGADFKYDNIFVKFYPKNTKIRLLCSRVKVILFSRELFEFKKFEGADFKYDNSLYPKNAILVLNLGHFSFSQKVGI